MIPLPTGGGSLFSTGNSFVLYWYYILLYADKQQTVILHLYNTDRLLIFHFWLCNMAQWYTDIFSKEDMRAQ